MTDTEPLDIDVLTSAGREIADDEEIGYLNVREYVASVEALIAEVRRLREEAEWEYAVEYSTPRGRSHVYGWTGWCTNDLAEAQEWARARLDGRVLRRRAPGVTETVSA